MFEKGLVSQVVWSSTSTVMLFSPVPEFFFAISPKNSWQFAHKQTGTLWHVCPSPLFFCLALVSGLGVGRRYWQKT